MQHIWSPLLLSLKVATISTVIVFLTACSLAYLFYNKQFKGKLFIEAIFLLPLVLPPTVIGFGLLVLFGKQGPLGLILEKWFGISVIFSWIGAVIASAIVSFPLMYQSTRAAFEKIDQRIVWVAETMGTSHWRLFWKIIFPLSWPGIQAGIVLSFARGLGEFGATLMIAGYIPGKTDTMPLAIYFAVEGGHMEYASLLVGIIVILGLSVISWLNYVGQTTKSKQIDRERK